MKKSIVRLMTIVSLLAISSIAFSQSTTPSGNPVGTPPPISPTQAPEYSIIVSTPVPPVPGMPIRSHTIRYSGAFSGETYEPFVIGPSNDPFTVVIEHVSAYDQTVYFHAWVVDGVAQPSGQTAITVSVDNLKPTIDVHAIWAESPPTSPPTPEPTPVGPGSSGSIWFDSSSLEFMLLDGTCVFVTNPDKFDTKVMLNTGTQRIAAFGIELTWDPLVMSVNTSLGNNGVDPGPDPLNITVNANNRGSLRIAGYDINGKGPSTAFHLITVHWLANAPGTTAIDIKIETLADQNATSITAFPESGKVTVTPSLVGDVNGSESVDIVDALLVAQYYVGLTPSTSSFNSCFADVNRSGSIDIIDALRIAQCYVGLSSCLF